MSTSTSFGSYERQPGVNVSYYFACIDMLFLRPCTRGEWVGDRSRELVDKMGRWMHRMDWSRSHNARLDVIGCPTTKLEGTTDQRA